MRFQAAAVSEMTGLGSSRCLWLLVDMHGYQTTGATSAIRVDIKVNAGEAFSK